MSWKVTTHQSSYRPLSDRNNWFEGLFPLSHIRKHVGKRWRSCCRHCTTGRKTAGSISDGVIGLYHWHNPSGHTVAQGSTQPLTGIFLVGKCGRCVGLTIFSSSCADCQEIWEPRPPEAVRSCPGGMLYVIREIPRISKRSLLTLSLWKSKCILFGKAYWLWTFGFREMRGISWLAANQLASQEGICNMEWVSK